MCGNSPDVCFSRLLTSYVCTSNIYWNGEENKIVACMNLLCSAMIMHFVMKFNYEHSSFTVIEV